MRYKAFSQFLLLIGLCFSLLANAHDIRTAEIRPDASTIWSKVALPDHWSDSRPTQSGTVWYRFTVSIETPSSLLGIYIKRACNNAWVYANGQLIHSGGGPIDGPRVRRNCYSPILASWPQKAQQKGKNEILIRLHSEASNRISSEQRKGHLSGIVIDQWQTLLPLFKSEYQTRINLALATCVVMGFAGLMLLFLWWGYLRERVYLYFSIALTAAAMGTARSFISDPGIDNLTVERIIPALVLLICLGISGSLIDFNEIRSRIYQFWWPAGSLFLVALFITPVSMLASTAIAVYGFGLASISVTIFEVIHHLRKDSVRAQKILFVSITFIFLIAIHDYLVQIRILTYTDRPLIQYAIPILLIGMMMRLLSRHAEALSVAERAKRELEERVSIITGEIERSYQESVGMLRASAARDERERIARDLHDDLGARLLTLVHRSHDEKTSESAREALADLRLLIGHLNQPEGSLDEAISDWRAETQDRCDAANRTLNWQITSISPCPLGTRQKITLGRILRESVTNILKHTDSPVITICILEKGGQLHMDIMDASLSTPVHTWRQGTGMRNLEMRAQQIGADLTWLDETTADGVKTGTRVRCQIPVRALNAAIMEPKK